MELIYLILTGSQLYSLAGPDSDKDYKGVFMPEPKRMLPTMDQILGLKQFSPHNKQSFDYTSGDMEGGEDIMFSLQYFTQLYMKGNPTLTEIPFANDEFVIEATDMGRAFMKFVRENMVTRHLFGGYMGFFNDQVKSFVTGKGRCREKRLRFKGELPPGYDIPADLHTRYVETKVKIENGMLTEGAKETLAVVGEVRRSLIAQGWYDGKMMSHAYRLGVQGVDLFTTGSFNPTLEGEQLEIARSLKFVSDNKNDPDRISREDAVAMVMDLGKQLEEAKETSPLPYEPDAEKVNRFIVDMQREYYIHK